MRVLANRRAARPGPKTPSCSAVSCLCDDGRAHDEAETIYQLVPCQVCHKISVHIHCAGLKASVPIFTCPLCQTSTCSNTSRRGTLRNRENDHSSESKINVKKQTSSKRKVSCDENNSQNKRSKKLALISTIIDEPAKNEIKQTCSSRQSAPSQKKTRNIRTTKNNSYVSTKKEKIVLVKFFASCFEEIQDLSTQGRDKATLTIAKNNLSRKSDINVNSSPNANSSKCQTKNVSDDVTSNVNLTSGEVSLECTSKVQNQKANSVLFDENTQSKVDLFNINSERTVFVKKFNGHIIMHFSKYLIEKKKLARRKRKIGKIFTRRIFYLNKQYQVFLHMFKDFKADTEVRNMKYSFTFIVNFNTKTIRSRKVLRSSLLDQNREFIADVEEELFYEICPQKPTSVPQGTRHRSSGRLGEKKNVTRRILISMQKLGRNPLIDRPLSFKSFTFDGVVLLKETTKISTKPKPVVPFQSKRIFKVTNILRKRRNPIWKSSKLNSRIKTMISRNGKIQMTVNQENPPEDAPSTPQPCFSKYYKIRRNSFSPKLVADKISPDCDSFPVNNKENTVMKIKIPKDIWVKAKRKKGISRAKSKENTHQQSSPTKVKVKYKNLYGRVIEYAKQLPRNL